MAGDCFQCGSEDRPVRPFRGGQFCEPCIDRAFDRACREMEAMVELAKLNATMGALTKEEEAAKIEGYRRKRRGRPRKPRQGELF